MRDRLRRVRSYLDAHAETVNAISYTMIGFSAAYFGIRHYPQFAGLMQDTGDRVALPLDMVQEMIATGRAARVKFDVVNMPDMIIRVAD